MRRILSSFHREVYGAAAANREGRAASDETRPARAERRRGRDEWSFSERTRRRSADPPRRCRARPSTIRPPAFPNRQIRPRLDRRPTFFVTPPRFVPAHRVAEVAGSPGVGMRRFPSQGEGRIAQHGAHVLADRRSSRHRPARTQHRAVFGEELDPPVEPSFTRRQIEGAVGVLESLARRGDILRSRAGSGYTEQDREQGKTRHDDSPSVEGKGRPSIVRHVWRAGERACDEWPRSRDEWPGHGAAEGRA